MVAASGLAREALLVGLGAVPGAWLRLRVVNHLQPVVPSKHWGTFAVNVLAAFFLGLFAGLQLQLKAQCQSADLLRPLMLLVGVGFFGSLSTFSTFVVELLTVLQQHKWLEALLLAVGSLLVGVLLAAAGYRLGLG